MFRGGPHRALPTEVFRLNTVGRVLRAPPRLTGEPLPTSVGGDAHIAPPIGVNAPTFCTVSGSGAGAETILNLGHVLLKPYLPTGKEVKKPSGFLRIFGYFLCAQKVTRQGHGHADSATDPVKTQKNRRSKNAAAAGIRCNALDYTPPGRVSQVITCTGFSRWVVSSMLLRFQLPAAYGSREACDPHTDPTSPITKCEDKKGLSRTAQGAGTASAALTDIV